MMLRRNSSNRLERRKSTSSVYSKHESIDPDMARQYAHLAATLAFARAQDKHRSNTGHSNGNPQLQRTNTSANRRDTQSSSQLADAEERGESVLRRQQSVRFVGPNAVQRRQSIGTRTKNPIIRKPSTTALRPIAMATSTPVPAQYRPPSRSSSLGKASFGKSSNLATLMTYDEYYTQEDDIASTPSSYRRIRKSKSMFTPLCAPDVFYTNGTPGRADGSYTGPLSNVSNSQTLQSSSADAPLRAPKSMSFLRGGREFRQSISGERNDVAVQMARDRFFQQAAQQRLREQPSFLFRSKSQRHEKPFRKSVRSNSGTHASSQAINSKDQQSSKESKLKEKARNVSRSLRIKLKRVFGRSKDEPVVIPNQQVDAPQTHVRGYHGDAGFGYHDFNDIPHPDDAAVSRVASRVPSLHNAISSQQLRSRAGSIKSTRSNQSDDKSRVTSWNTGVSTITSQITRTQAEREQQRLSIINENGSHMPSSSFTRPQNPTQPSAHPVLHRTSRSFNHPPPTAHGAIDSARVYSALMKRLDENSPKARLEAARKPSEARITPQKQYRARSSSANTTHINRSPATIRHVSASHISSSSSSKTSSTVNHTHSHRWISAESFETARGENLDGYGDTHVHQWVQSNLPHSLPAWTEDDVFSPEDMNNQLRGPSVGVRRDHSSSSKILSSLSHKPSINTATSYHTVPETLNLTPQGIALRNELLVPERRGLRETRSTFFGGTNITAAKTPSPYRKALAEAQGLTDFNPAVVTGDTPVPAITHQPPLTTVLRHGISHQREKHVTEGQWNPAYTESVYSRTTSGLTPGAANSALSLLLPSSDRHITTSKVVDVSKPNDGVFPEQIPTSYRPPMPHVRIPSSTEPSEWKIWMSAEVANLERGKENLSYGGTTYVNYAFPTLANSRPLGAGSLKGRHLREKAQMWEDETDIAAAISHKGVCEFAGGKQPLGEVEQNSNLAMHGGALLKPILKNESKTSLKLGVVVGAENSYPFNIPPPLPIPSRSPLRRMHSQASIATVQIGSPKPGSVPGSASLKGRYVLHKKNASSTTLRIINSKATENAQTPAKLVKRQRPNNTNARRGATKTPSPGAGLTDVVESRFGIAGSGPKLRRSGSAKGGSEKSRSRSRSRTPGAAYFTPGMFSVNAKDEGNDGDGNVGKERRKEFSYDVGVDDEIDVGERVVDSLGREESEGHKQPTGVGLGIGSKRMVDLFLNSRRKRVGGGSEEGEEEEDGRAAREGGGEGGAVFL